MRRVHILDIGATCCEVMPSSPANDKSTNDEDDLFIIEEDQPEPTPADVKPWNVLIVDDDPDVHEVTRLNLRRVRFRATRLIVRTGQPGQAPTVARHLPS
jgi:hypothetical protein